MQRERGFAVKAVIGESRGYRNPYFLEVLTASSTDMPGSRLDVPLTPAGKIGTRYTWTPISGFNGKSGNVRRLHRNNAICEGPLC